MSLPSSTILNVKSQKWWDNVEGNDVTALYIKKIVGIRVDCPNPDDIDSDINSSDLSESKWQLGYSDSPAANNAVEGLTNEIDPFFRFRHPSRTAPIWLRNADLEKYNSFIYVPFEDGTTMDDTTIGQVLGAFSGLENVNCVGLVTHLQETNNAYPQVLNDGEPMAQWARHMYTKWLGPEAAVLGTWP